MDIHPFFNLHQPLHTTSASYFFETSQWIKAPLVEVFNFFSEANNLSKITPAALEFKILGLSTPEIQENTFIDYQLKLHGIPFFWKTKIVNFIPPYLFTDIQLKGPYHTWHHTHAFFPHGDKTLMLDRVHYQLPMGILGRLCAGFWVRKEVEKIFSYRERVLQSFF